MEVNSPSAFTGCNGPPQPDASVPGQSCTSLCINEVAERTLSLRRRQTCMKAPLKTHPQVRKRARILTLLWWVWAAFRRARVHVRLRA